MFLVFLWHCTASAAEKKSGTFRSVNIGAGESLKIDVREGELYVFHNPSNFRGYMFGMDTLGKTGMSALFCNSNGKFTIYNDLSSHTLLYTVYPPNDVKCNDYLIFDNYDDLRIKFSNDYSTKYFLNQSSTACIYYTGIYWYTLDIGASDLDYQSSLTFDDSILTDNDRKTFYNNDQPVVFLKTGTSVDKGTAFINAHKENSHSYEGSDVYPRIISITFGKESTNFSNFPIGAIIGIICGVVMVAIFSFFFCKVNVLDYFCKKSDVQETPVVYSGTNNQPNKDDMVSDVYSIQNSSTPASTPYNDMQSSLLQKDEEIAPYTQSNL